MCYFILYLGTIKLELEEESRDWAEKYKGMLFREAAWKNLQYLPFTHRPRGLAFVGTAYQANNN